MRPPICVARLLVAGVLTIATAACQGRDAAEDDIGIGITGTRFDPATLTVPAGQTTIVIANNDPFTHTFTLDDESIDQEIPAGDTARITLTITQTTPFHCRIHPTSMTGTLQVT